MAPNSDSSDYEEEEPNVLVRKPKKYQDLDNPDSDPNNSMDYESALEYYKRREKDLPDMSKACIVDEVDMKSGNFKKIIDDLLLEPAVTLVLEGVTISRLGELHWIAIGTKEKQYLFNIHQMGQNAFDKGLTFILEDVMILKIVYDCRGISDCLFHHYLVGIRNVFDTQVAGSVIFKQKFGFLSNFSESLGHLLKIYVGLNPNRLPKLNPNAEVEKDRLREKPISPVLKRVLVAKAIYLHALKEKLTEKMFEEFEAAVTFHLSSVRDAADSELPKLMAASHMMPVPKGEKENVEKLQNESILDKAWWERDPETGQLEILDPNRSKRLKLSDRWGQRCVYKHS